MPEMSQFTLFFAAAALLAVTPGPGIFYVAARALSGGRAEGVASSFGTGLGVSAVVLASAELFTALKLLGAGYLVWVEVRTVLAARRDARAAPEGEAVLPPLGARRAFREGVVVEALNPRTAAFFLAFVPQFVEPAAGDMAAGDVAAQFVVLGLVSVALNTLADLVVALAAARIRAGAGARPGLVRRLREVSGAAMVALGLGLALARRPASVA